MFHETALHNAAKKGDPKIIKFLLIRKGVNINIKDNQGKKPIDYCENPEIKQLLLK